MRHIGQNNPRGYLPLAYTERDPNLIHTGICRWCAHERGYSFDVPLSAVVVHMEPVWNGDLACDCSRCGDRFAGPTFAWEVGAADATE